MMYVYWTLAVIYIIVCFFLIVGVAAQMCDDLKLLWQGLRRRIDEWRQSS